MAQNKYQNKKNIRQTQTKNNAKQQQPVAKPFSWIKFCSKVLILFAIVVAVVVYTDHKEFFKADQSNNHVDRKWKSFYKFTKNKQVDILLCGNSHIITGIDPFVLSCATSTNSFILGTPGVSIVDTYFSLCDALKHTTPKVIVIETYAISGNNDKDNGSMFQIMSFEAHNNFWYKMRMMPELFNNDSWVKAWSPTIRNHSFLLTNKEQIDFNIKNYGKLSNDQNKLDLGRFSRFDKGLQAETLAKYDSIGAPVDGSKFTVSERSKKYLKKIMTLCKEKEIPVLFLTIPMYYKHIYDYEHWKNVLAEELKKYPDAKWIDWQMPYDTTTFTPEIFENTYEANQHLSNFGMTVTAYNLADFLLQNNPYHLPDRSQEPQWIADFKNQPHFIFNQNVPSGMSGYYIVAKEKKADKFFVKELSVQQNQNHDRIFLKVENRPDLPPTIVAEFVIQYQNQEMTAPIQMQTFREVSPILHKLYIADIRKEVKVLDVKY
ncbi:hypothetical protein AGMMS50262_16820 [Bacteroidia bacterium]|nr:hypothetical protein AGMMS50262_16820 [Bacteroidia bacterium]